MGYVTKVEPPFSRPEGLHVLCYSEAWGQGGIETFLMGLFNTLQGKGFVFSLFSTWDWNEKMDAELKKLGIDRYTVFSGYKPGQVKRLCESSATFRELIGTLGPDVVYVNTMNGMGFLYSSVAKHMGIPVRVVHSHNSAFGSGQVAAKMIMHNFGKTRVQVFVESCVSRKKLRFSAVWVELRIRRIRFSRLGPLPKYLP